MELIYQILKFFKLLSVTLGCILKSACDWIWLVLGDTVGLAYIIIVGSMNRRCFGRFESIGIV